LGSSQRGIIDLVVTDFDRTLGRLFPQRDHERDVYEDVWRMYADHDLPRDVRAAAGGSPYSLWTTAYKWMEERIGRSDAEAVYQTVAERLTHHELDAAESLLLFDGVRLTLERMRASGIPVAVVSNNSTEAVERALKVNKVEGLVQTVAGRQPAAGVPPIEPSWWVTTSSTSSPPERPASTARSGCIATARSRSSRCGEWEPGACWMGSATSSRSSSMASHPLARSPEPCRTLVLPL
jgi:phosphoglycolate phosphatase-like HAD superfamily hydrolase